MHILQVSGLARLVQFDPSRDRLVTFSSMVISTEWAPTPGEVLQQMAPPNALGIPFFLSVVPLVVLITLIFIVIRLLVCV